MGGSGKGGAPSNPQLEQSQTQVNNQLAAMLGQQQGQSQQLYNLAFPGMQQADQFYSALASGSPNLLAAATAPAAQQIQQQTAGAKQNILTTAPAGGEKNLAIENADVAQGAQIGALASQGYTSSFNALASLGGRGVSLGQGAAGTAIGAGQAASSGYGQTIQENIQQKGQTLGAIGSGVGDVTSMLSF